MTRPRRRHKHDISRDPIREVIVSSQLQYRVNEARVHVMARVMHLCPEIDTDRLIAALSAFELEFVDILLEAHRLIRLSPELHARLAQAAEERDLSINYLVNRAVTEFLPRLIPVEELWSSLTRRPEPEE